MDDETKQDRLLQSATQWQHRPSHRFFSAGDEAAAMLRRRAAQFNRNTAVVDAWERIVPPGLKRWCRLDSCSGNVLTIQAAPGPYMYQLQLMQNDVLAELQRCCPSAGIQKLRIIPWKTNNEDV